MSLHSTFSAATARIFESISTPPSEYEPIYYIETNATNTSRYTSLFVSRENIGNGQFVVAKQSFIGNVTIRNVANTFSKTISNLTANSGVGSYNAIINEQGNLVAVGNSDYIKIYEYQGSNYTLISNLRPDANATFFNGQCIDFSSNANTLICGCGGNTAPFVAIYNRTGNTFTLQENIIRPTGNGQFGSSLSISADGNTFITSGLVSSNSLANTSFALIYTKANGNFTLDTVLSNPNANSYFGDVVKLNSTGNIALIKSFTRIFVYEKINNTWTLTDNIGTSGRGVGANQSSASSEFSVSSNGTMAFIGNIDYNNGITNQGRLQNYYKNNRYTFSSGETWPNAYANSKFSFNIASDDNANYLATTNYFNGANSNVHVLAVYQKE